MLLHFLSFSSVLLLQVIEQHVCVTVQVEVHSAVYYSNCSVALMRLFGCCGVSQAAAEAHDSSVLLLVVLLLCPALPE